MAQNQDSSLQDPSQEPSIEEILASIRKIISEDDPAGEADQAMPAPQASFSSNMTQNDFSHPPVNTAMNDEDDILELTDFLEENAALDIMPLKDPVQDIPPPVQTFEVRPKPEERLAEIEKPAPRVMDNESALISSFSENAATEAMARLARSNFTAPKQQADSAAMTVSSRSLDKIVEDMLRPMLAEWLDGNLPRLVEKLVERELNRMARHAEER